MKKLFFIITTLLLVSLIHAVIPSEQAADVAGAYARSGELTQPATSIVKIDVKDYWLVYYIPENNPNGKNGMAVVSADDGVLVFDEKILLKAHQFETRLEKVQDFFAKNDNLKLNNIKESIDFSSKAQDQAEETLSDLSDKLQDRNVNLANVQTSLAGLRGATETFSSKIDIAQEQERLFYSGDYSYNGLNGFIKSYSETLSSYEKFLESAINYQKLIINKSKELTAKQIPTEEFMPSLQSANKVGIEKFLTIDGLTNPNSGVQKKIESITDKNSDELANTSIKNFLYRKASVDSKKAFDEMDAIVKPIIDSKIEVEKCTSLKKLQTTYTSAVEKNKINSLVAFTEVVKLSSEAKVEAEAVQSKFDKCVADRQKANAKSNVVTPEKKEDNTLLYIGIAVVLIAIYLVSQFMKKKKEVENLGDDEHSGSSLFESKGEHH